MKTWRAGEVASQDNSRPPSSLSPSRLLGGSTHLSLTEVSARPPKPCDPCMTPTEGGACLPGQTLCCASQVCTGCLRVYLQADRPYFDQAGGSRGQRTAATPILSSLHVCVHARTHSLIHGDVAASEGGDVGKMEADSEGL